MQIFHTKVRVTPDALRSHIQVKFSVPEGLEYLTVATFYSPKYEYDEKKCAKLVRECLEKYAPYREFSYEEIRRNFPLANHIAWSLHDGEKQLGTEHRHKPDQTHVISEKYSSNGFIATKVRAGKWTLTASINSIVTDFIDIDVTVEGFTEKRDFPTEKYDSELYAVNDCEKGKLTWQRVEMHCHTVASDGDMTPKELVQNAIKRGYKGICLTDHNTVSNVKAVEEWGKKYNLAVARGIEWTTFWGHLTVIGGNSKVNWLDIRPENINACIVQARQSGDIVTLAHPKRIGWPLCAGCYNDFGITNWDYLTSYEVWSHYDPNVSLADLQAKREWISLLDKGYRLAAMYGYDWHSPDEGGPSYAYTYLGIDGILDKDSIVKAVECGRTYITMGWEINVELCDGENSYGIGDILPIGRYRLKISYNKASDYPFDSKLESLSVKGNSCEEYHFACAGGKGEIKEEIYLAKEGYMRIEGTGFTEGKYADVLLTSPVYVKEIKK